MTIGVDISAIQGPHRMRGIGYTLINLINHLPDKVKKKHKFVLYALPDHLSNFNPLDILDLTGVTYEIRTLPPQSRINIKLPGRFNLFISALNALLDIFRLWRGTSGYDLKDVDAFLQADQNKSYPHKRRLKKILIIYDLIPYTVEWDYMWSYTTARHIKGFSRKAAFRVAMRRRIYKFKVGLNTRKANLLIAISETTKCDFIDVYRINEKRIKVIPLGVPEAKTVVNKKPTLMRYEKTSWGYLPRPLELNDEPFLLFVGGADKRRRLQDLVAAFNCLRAQGISMRLVLAGDSMKSPAMISTEEIQYALSTSSYLDDIAFMGFIDDTTRDWLYTHALAFIFPSRYEGFGLPVLEAMSYGCPVISYPNAATLEVASNAPLYVNDIESLKEGILRILDSNVAANMKSKGLKEVAKYSWAATSERVCDILIDHASDG